MKRPDVSGFTIIELMVSIALIAVTLFAFLQVTAYSFTTRELSSEYAQAQALTETLVDEVKGNWFLAVIDASTSGSTKLNSDGLCHERGTGILQLNPFIATAQNPAGNGDLKTFIQNYTTGVNNNIVIDCSKLQVAASAVSTFPRILVRFTTTIADHKEPDDPVPNQTFSARITITCTWTGVKGPTSYSVDFVVAAR